MAPPPGALPLKQGPTGQQVALPYLLAGGPFKLLIVLQREFKNPSKQQQKTVLNNETNTRYGA
jgi:hypothetical protein